MKLIKIILILFFINNNLLAKTSYFDEGLVLYEDKKLNEAKFKFEQDIVYNPKKTLLCRYAKKLNFNFINGIKMNTVQAEIALKKIENYYKS